ncbi:MAG TPA: hypothetical protein VEQ61_07395, partial [Thermoleophilaceae bacterium]|nr:hypothetical protein [Thermoleophilaceae bacterium]
MPRPWPAEQVHEALALCRQGLSDAEAGRRSGIPCRTVNGWRRGNRRARAEPDWSAWRPPEGAAYCYLLGVYLGDGHIATNRGKAPSIRIAHDSTYTDITGEISDALERTFPGRAVRTFDYMKGHCISLCLRHPALLSAFPQHGPGRKHLREIQLLPWQLELT